MATDKNSFSKKEAIRFGWETTKKNFWFLLGILLVTCLVQFIPNIFSRYLKDQLAISIIISIIIYIVSMGFSLGAIKIYLSFVDGKKPLFSDLYSLFDAGLLFRYFLASLRYGAITFLSVLPSLLIIVGGPYLVRLYNLPSIYTSISLLVGGLLGLFVAYVVIRYSVYTYFIVDKNMGVRESFSKSWEITNGVVLDLVLFNLLLGLIAVVGLLALGVGLLFVIPLTSLAQAHVYRQLSSKVTKAT